MKKNLLFLTLSLIIALLMCVSAFALTLDSAESWVTSENEAELQSSYEDFDVVFSEDFEGFEAPVQIDDGKWSGTYTPAKIENLGWNWSSLSDKVYLYCIDSFPGLSVLADSMSAGENNALFMDRYSGSGGFPGVAVWGHDEAADKALGISRVGEYGFKFDYYVPEKIQQASYSANGNDNGLTVGDSITVRAEFTDGTLLPMGITFTADTIGTWQTVKYSFAIEDGQTLNLIRIFNGDADEFVIYFDNLKLFRKVSMADIYLDADRTVKSVDSPFIFGVNDYITLPAASECAEYTPNGYQFVGFAKGGELYAPGSDYTFTVADTKTMIDFTPVYIPENAELVFFEDFSDFASGTALQVEGVNKGFKSNGVQPAYSKYENEFYIGSGHGGNRSLYVYNVGTTSNKALLIDHKADGFNGGGFTTTFAEPGKYVFGAKTFVPSVVENSGYAVNGESNEVFAGKGSTVRVGENFVEFSGVALEYDKWQYAEVPFTIDTVGLTYLTFYNGANSAGVNYYDDFILYRIKEYASIYLDADKTALAEKVEFVPGTTVTLPSADELAAYVPEGKELKGFVIGGDTYTPGSVYTFTADNTDGMEIAPVYAEALVPSYGDLVFFDDFQSYEANTPATFGLSAPSNTFISMTDACVGTNWTNYADEFNYVSGAGIRDIRVRSMTAYGGNKALQLEGWYVTEYIGAYVGNYELSGNTANDTVTGKDYATISATKGMNLDKAGNYRVNVKAYIPSTLTQCTDAWRNGRVNKVATVMVRAEFANGGIKTATLEIDETNRDSWQDITLDFAVEEGDALNYILLYAYVETNSETDTSRYGEVFFDEVKLYSVDATLTYAKENGDVISEQTYFPGSEITLPGKDVVGFEPVYEISGKQYFAGD